MPVAIPIKVRMHGEDRRRQLLKAAIDCFALKGFSGTKTKDIAAAAGVSEAILFRHFASKEDLYHAILDMREETGAIVQTARGGDFNRFLAELEGLAALRDDSGFFTTLATAIVHSFRDDPAFHRLLLYASLEGHLLADLFRARFGLPMGNFLKRYIVLRQKEGAFYRCDPDVAMTFFFGAIVHYAMCRFLFDVQEHPQEDRAAVKELVTLVLRGFKKGSQ